MLLFKHVTNPNVTNSLIKSVTTCYIDTYKKSVNPNWDAMSTFHCLQKSSGHCYGDASGLQLVYFNAMIWFGFLRPYGSKVNWGFGDRLTLSHSFITKLTIFSFHSHTLIFCFLCSISDAIDFDSLQIWLTFRFHLNIHFCWVVTRRRL